MLVEDLRLLDQRAVYTCQLGAGAQGISANMLILYIQWAALLKRHEGQGSSTYGKAADNTVSYLRGGSIRSP